MIKVLIVDDSLMMRKKIRTIIESLGHKVVSEARSAEEAVNMHSKFLIYSALIL